MNAEQFGSEDTSGSQKPSGLGEGRPQTGGAVSMISDLAQKATEQAKNSAGEAASMVTHQVKDLLNQQVGSGAEMVGHMAHSVQRAAEDLDQNAPQIAGLVRGLAGRLEGFAEDMRGQSVDQLVRAASDFTRRQPALVFSLAAVAGFFALRTFKSAPSLNSAPSIVPSYPEGGAPRGGASQFQAGGSGSQPGAASRFHGV